MSASGHDDREVGAAGVHPADVPGAEVVRSDAAEANGCERYVPGFVVDRAGDVIALLGEEQKPLLGDGTGLNELAQQAGDVDAESEGPGWVVLG